MRIFVGYGYNQRDRWIEDYVLPLIVAFGHEAVHGKAVYGGRLLDEVTKAIRMSDAMLGFTTRRELAAPGKWRTHEWVVQELLTAHAQEPRIPWVEIREEGVISPGGILESAGAQRIDYREEERAGCLVKIVQALRRLHDLTNVIMIRLGPLSAVEQIRRLLRHPTFFCECQTLRGDVELEPWRTPVLAMRGGLFVQPRGISRTEPVRITISARGRIWRSDYELLDTVDVQVRE